MKLQSFLNKCIESSWEQEGIKESDGDEGGKQRLAGELVAC